MSAVADMRSDAAEKQRRRVRHSVEERRGTVERDDIEIVINLTVPMAHVEVGLAVIAAGKHVYSEKPLGVDVAEGASCWTLAAAGLRLGCAPDTFLGGDLQTARHLIDEGAIGTPVAGSAYFIGPGHESWHPNPASSTPRRRAHARHGPLLHHRPRQPPRPGRARHGLDRAAAPDALVAASR